jgi:hypothetical protein
MMPQDMGGLPPGADVESQRPGYRNKRGLFAVPKNHITTSIASLSGEKAQSYQCEKLRMRKINEEKR